MAARSAAESGLCRTLRREAPELDAVAASARATAARALAESLHAVALAAAAVTATARSGRIAASVQAAPASVPLSPPPGNWLDGGTAKGAAGRIALRPVGPEREEEAEARRC